MSLAAIVWNYGKWHYGQSLSQLAVICRDILKFTANYFSFFILIKSLFCPWRRLGESYPNSWLDGWQILSVFIVNILMRAVGFLARGSMIIVGLISIAVVALSIPVIFLIWLLLPPLALFLAFTGLYLIILF